MVTLPVASMFRRSVALSTAYLRDGAHTLLAQLIFCVGSLEITISALATTGANAAVNTAAATMFLNDAMGTLKKSCQLCRAISWSCSISPSHYGILMKPAVDTRPVMTPLSLIAVGLVLVEPGKSNDEKVPSAVRINPWDMVARP